MSSNKSPVPHNLFILFVYLSHNTLHNNSLLKEGSSHTKLVKVTSDNEAEINTNSSVWTAFLTIVPKLPFSRYHELRNIWLTPSIFGYKNIDHIHGALHSMGWDSQSKRILCIRGNNRFKIADDIYHAFTGSNSIDNSINKTLSPERANFITNIRQFSYGFGVRAIERQIITPENINVSEVMEPNVTSVTILLLWNFTWSFDSYNLTTSYCADCYCTAIY